MKRRKERKNQCVNCIECNSPPIQLISQHKISHNVRTAVISFSGPFNSKPIEHRRYSISVVSSQQIPYFKVEAFPDTSPLFLAAVAKPADPTVLLYTRVLRDPNVGNLTSISIPTYGDVVSKRSTKQDFVKTCHRRRSCENIIRRKTKDK